MTPSPCRHNTDDPSRIGFTAKFRPSRGANLPPLMPVHPNPALINRVTLADGLGPLGLYLYSFTAWLSPHLHAIGLAMSGLALLMTPIALRRILPTRACIVWLSIALYLCAQSLWGNHLFPGSLEDQLQEAGRWLSCGGFLIVGWWFKGDPRIIRNCLGLALLGLCVGLVHSAGWAALLSFQTGKQTGFHLTASTAALLAATAILGLLLSAPGPARTPSGRIGHAMKMVTWCTAMYLMLYLLVASQSRATWVAALIAIPLTLRIRKLRSQTIQKPRRLPGPGWWVLLIIIFGIGLNRHMILDRITPDLAVVKSSLEFGKNNNNENPSSLGYRLKAQQFGLQKWREHLWVGWGPASTRRLISESERPDLWHEPTHEWLNHVHNSYLEVLLRFGLLGAVFFAISGLILLRGFLSFGAWQQLQAHQLSWLMTGSVLMLGLWAGAVFQFTNPAWQTYFTFILATGFSVSIFPGYKTRTAVESSASKSRPADGFDATLQTPDP